MRNTRETLKRRSVLTLVLLAENLLPERIVLSLVKFFVFILLAILLIALRNFAAFS